ncbi:MAG: tetratricopeptide repeat protein [Gammaproteobacteria bacterium]|nr:tetratricopeptide repeat protein [Gammaproteobacteria bacterium]
MQQRHLLNYFSISNIRIVFSVLIVSLCLLFTPHRLSAESNTDITVQDLRYGEVLFYYYQDKYFSAITRLMQARKYNPIKNQGKIPEVLLGGLFLGYGLRDDSVNIFNTLLESHTEQATQDQAWYYLGKSWYRIKDMEKAAQALNKVSPNLPEERMNERHHLLANIFQQQGKYTEAEEMLDNISKQSIWKSYTHYNLGVALIKAGKTKDGLELLDEVSDIEPHSEELAGLKDRANLALGFSYIQKNNTYNALSYLKKIRLHGPHSNKALLGLGWAHSLLQQHPQSLVPWHEAARRPALDPSVQESLLAIAWANDEAGHTEQALADYERALIILAAEKTNLDRVINAVKNGELKKVLHPHAHDLEIIVPLEIKRASRSDTLPYLNELLASGTFQSAYKNYRDLVYLRSILQDWQHQLPAFKSMLSERIITYNKKLKRVSTDPRLQQLKKYKSERNKLANEFSKILKSEDALALATDEELKQLQILNRIKTGLDTFSQLEELQEQRDKYQRLYGILTWDISTDYAPRTWSVERQFQELGNELKKTSAAEKSLANTWKTAPRYFNAHARKLTQHRGNLARLTTDINTLLQHQSDYLHKLALNELDSRRQALNDYQIRAQYNLSLLLDRLSSPSYASKQVQP